MFLISLMGGWGRIAEAYPNRQSEAADCLSLQSAILRLSSSYSGVLRLCTDEHGVYFSVLFLYRPGHPPFFVPWTEISGRRTTYFIYQMVDLRFDRTPNLPFRLYKRTADKLVEAANGRWSYEEK